MGGCQNYGPFLDPHYNTAPNIEIAQKRTTILTTTHKLLLELVRVFSIPPGVGLVIGATANRSYLVYSIHKTLPCLQVCWGAGAAPSSELFAGATVLSKMVNLSGHAHQKLATCMVKALKNMILFSVKQKDVQNLGRDAAERLKQDPKLEELGQACSHSAALEKALAEVGKLREDAGATLTEAGNAVDDNADNALAMPEEALLKLDLQQMFHNMAPSEVDDVIKDCVEAKLAELCTTLDHSQEEPRHRIRVR